MSKVKYFLALILAAIISFVGIATCGLLWLLGIVLSIGVPTAVVLWILDYVKLINIW